MRYVVLACMSLTMVAACPALAADDVFALSPAPASAQLSPVADTAPMRVILTLPLSDQAGADSYAEAVSDPQSSRYGRYLTPEEFGARFGANAADYELLRNWAEAAGLTVGPRLASRAEISLGGTAGRFAAIFGVHFRSFPNERGGGYTVTNHPVLPALLAGRVDGVIGLTSQARLGLLLRPHVGHADIGNGIDDSGLAPSDLVSAYDVVEQTGASSETVAVFEQDGYHTTDIATYASGYALPAVANRAVSVNGSTTEVTNNGAELEADLDIEMLVAMNPKLKNILVYIDSQDTFQTALLDAINQVAQDQKASVLSISYGQDEINQGHSAIAAENKALAQLQTQGITVVVSAGDSGVGGDSGFGQHVADPCTQLRVTCVGGTHLSIAANTSAYVGEVVWNDLNTTGDGATGGGVSSVWKIPNWQLKGGVSVAAANGGSSTYRNVPDVAAVADFDNSPVSVYSANYGGWFGVGGTSVAAPIWGGWVTIFNGERVAASKARLGWINPKLYNLGKADRPFHDITEGNNGIPGYDPGFSAGVGYDNTTGWGSIDVGKALPEFTH